MRDVAVPSGALTDQSCWDSYWSSVSLPREHKRQPKAFYLNAILDGFDEHLPRGTTL
jgi:hypothetical protein